MLKKVEDAIGNIAD